MPGDTDPGEQRWARPGVGIVERRVEKSDPDPVRHEELLRREALLCRRQQLAGRHRPQERRRREPHAQFGQHRRQRGQQRPVGRWFRRQPRVEREPGGRHVVVVDAEHQDAGGEQQPGDVGRHVVAVEEPGEPLVPGLVVGGRGQQGGAAGEEPAQRLEVALEDRVADLPELWQGVRGAAAQERLDVVVERPGRLQVHSGSLPRLRSGPTVAPPTAIHHEDIRPVRTGCCGSPEERPEGSRRRE